MADTSLVEIAPSNNLGAQLFCNSGTANQGSASRNRALFRFDPAVSIPADARILDATLVLEVTGEPSSGAESSVFGLHRVLRPWGEGARETAASPGLGLPAEPGEATWTHRFAASGETWSVPGGAAGVDYVAIPSAMAVVYGVNDSPYRFGPTSELVADVQAWLDEPGGNAGWMLVSASETVPKTARRFGSRESGLDSPRLEVRFAISPRISSATVVGGWMELGFQAEAGVVYRGEWASPLGAEWNTFTNLPPLADTAVVTFRDPVGTGHRFFRVVME